MQRHRQTALTQQSTRSHTVLQNKKNTNEMIPKHGLQPKTDMKDQNLSIQELKHKDFLLKRNGNSSL